LPRRTPTTELGVINLIPQHDPQTNPEFPSRRDFRLREAFLLQLAPVEALQRGVMRHGMLRGFTPQKPQEGIALFTNCAFRLI